MQYPTINFRYNFNRKLDNPMFTTIRIWQPEKYKVGHWYCNSLGRHNIGVAEILEGVKFELAKLPPITAALDTGYNLAITRKIIHDMYPRYNGPFGLYLQSWREREALWATTPDMLAPGSGGDQPGTQGPAKEPAPAVAGLLSDLKRLIPKDEIDAPNLVAAYIAIEIHRPRLKYDAGPEDTRLTKFEIMKDMSLFNPEWSEKTLMEESFRGYQLAKNWLKIGYGLGLWKGPVKAQKKAANPEKTVSKNEPEMQLNFAQKTA